MASLVNRMVRAAKLDSALYEEVEADSSALGQAMGVVVIASVAAGIGNMANGGVTGPGSDAPGCDVVVVTRRPPLSGCADRSADT